MDKACGRTIPVIAREFRIQAGGLRIELVIGCHRGALATVPVHLVGVRETDPVTVQEFVHCPEILAMEDGQALRRMDGPEIALGSRAFRKIDPAIQEEIGPVNRVADRGRHRARGQRRGMTGQPSTESRPVQATAHRSNGIADMPASAIVRNPGRRQSQRRNRGQHLRHDPHRDRTSRRNAKEERR